MRRDLDHELRLCAVARRLRDRSDYMLSDAGRWLRAAAYVGVGFVVTDEMDREAVRRERLRMGVRVAA